MNRLTVMTLGGVLVSGLAIGAGRAAARPRAAPSAVPAAAPGGPAGAPAGVRSILLPTIESDLPPGPGRDAVASACVLCHSPRYITGQPPFSRQVWAAEVDKMRRSYGAPVEEAQVQAIVDYLVTIRGAEPPAGR